MSLVLLLAACVSDAPKPFVGDCAVYPEGAYDFGAIGIGSCLSGPVDLAWMRDPADPTGAVLLVTNANPFLDFSSSSMVSVPLSGVPLDGGEITVAEAGGAGVEVPNFASSMALAEELGLVVVPSRYSDDGRLRESDDEIWFIDVSAPAVPALAGVAADGATSLKVKEDPTPVLWLPETGLVLVGNASDESITVVDLAGSPVAVIDAIDTAEVLGVRVFDGDRSGSNIAVTDLAVSTATDVPSDDWTLTYTLGTFRAWVPSGDGIRRMTSHGQEGWQDSAVGVEFDGEADTNGVLGELFDPQIWDSVLSTRMAFGDAASGSLHAATNIGSLTEWSYDATPLLEPRADEWDAFLGGPMLLVSDDLEYLFFDGVDAPGPAAVGGIGLATSRDGVDFDRLDTMLIAPGAGTHDSQRVADPTVLFDPQARLWRMWYGAYDGTTWRIGHATSTDLTSWSVESQAVFEATLGAGAAAPVVTYVGGWFRMWTTREDVDGTPWLGLALSRDGTIWEDQGLVSPLQGAISSLDEPIGVGLQSSRAETWSVAGEQSGQSGVAFQGSEGLVSTQFGWTVRLSTGWWLAPTDGLDASANGVAAGSWIPELGRVFVTLTGDDGVSRIGSATWTAEAPVLASDLLLEGTGGIASAGVSSPVVFETAGGWGMLYAGSNGTLTRIGLATSADGATWSTDQTAVLDVGPDWDSVALVPGSVVADGSTLTLYYTGFDGERRRVGQATSTDEGRSWTRVEGDRDPWVFDEGAPGEFDDNEVKDPFVLRDASTGLEQLWYAGNDGARWRIGYAERAQGQTGWTRFEDPVRGQTLVVLEGVPGAFDVAGAERPVVVHDDDGYTLLYSGQDSPVLRTGLARGLEPDTLFRTPADPTTGDMVEFETRAGDDGGRNTIPLERIVDGFSVNGSALTAFAHDEDRGLVFIGSTSNSYIIVLDVRDDSQAWFTDNYLGIEAVLDARTNAGAVGFRSLAVSGDRLYGLNDAPESVMIFDLDAVVDDDRGDYLPEAVIGYLPTPRGVEQDAGADTLASVGPSGLAFRGDRLFVTNFNDNSVGVYDLALGLDGAMVDEVANLGENPHAIALSPDGSLLAVSLFVGDVSQGTSESAVVLIDADPDSPTYLAVVARIVNR